MNSVDDGAHRSHRREVDSLGTVAFESICEVISITAQFGVDFNLWSLKGLYNEEDHPSVQYTPEVDWCFNLRHDRAKRFSDLVHDAAEDTVAGRKRAPDTLAVGDEITVIDIGVEDHEVFIKVRVSGRTKGPSWTIRMSENCARELSQDLAEMSRKLAAEEAD